MSYSLSSPSTFVAAPSPSSFYYISNVCGNSPNCQQSTRQLNMSLDDEVQMMYNHFEQVGLQCLDIIRVIGLWIVPLCFIASHLFAMIIDRQETLWRFLFLSSFSPFSSAASRKHLVMLKHILADILDREEDGNEENDENTSENESNGRIINSNNSNSKAHQKTKMKSNKINENEATSTTKPRHIAVIMDGNRRYGKQHLGSSLLGHRVGGEKLREFVRWCRGAEIEMLTVYAFSTENWNRPKQEVDLLMDLFSSFFNQMLLDAEEIGIRIRFMSSEPEKLPDEIRSLMRKVELHTRQFGSNDQGKSSITVNVCASYGSRSSILKSCQEIISDKNNHHAKLDEEEVSALMMKELGTSFVEREEQQKQERSDETKTTTTNNNNRHHSLYERDLELWSSPDILIRTSGEVRLSNFMLLELAYTEMFFWKCTWPEVTLEMLNDCLDEFSDNRQRRMGK